MLSKQSIRSNIQIFLNGKLATKDEIIELAKSWSNNEEILFRKLLKQSGKVKIKGYGYEIILKEQILNSKGNVETAMSLMDHKGDDVDIKYLK